VRVLFQFASLSLLARTNHVTSRVAPVTHWPWWLRIVAVAGALLFVQIVARSMRKGAGRQGPGPSQSD